ncbi:MAG: cob(I)yrinic acid a,c-diamide adenosyltransferase [Pseudomonadales bacterium]
MGKRLSKIYTKTGDSGETGLGDGSRISKNMPRVEAMGSVDELNSLLGVLVEEIRSEDNTALIPISEFLRQCQHRIFDLGGELSIPGYAIIHDHHVERIEEALDSINENLAPLENFILPGGSRSIATCHWARSVCRRAERDVVSLGETDEINEAGLKFLNRLSDYLFVAARQIAKVQGIPEVLWEKDG